MNEKLERAVKLYHAHRFDQALAELRALETDASCKVGQSVLLGKDLDDLLGEYRAVWLERNRPGGLAESLAFFKAYDE